MSFEIPKTRSEKILQNILGAKNEIEPIQSRIEAILYAILNDTEIGDPYTAPARCEIEKLLVAIKDGGEYNETPLSRSGRILLCKLRGEDYSGTTQSRLEKLFLRWLYELMEITDVPPFTFKSKGNNLIDYDIYGAEDGVGDHEDVTVSGNPITVTDAIEAPAESLQVTFTPTQDGTPSIDSDPTTEPYLSKVVPRGNKEYYSLVGGTVNWNQMVLDGDLSDGGNGWSTPTHGTSNLVISDGIAVITATTAPQNVYDMAASATLSVSRIANHKYLLRYNVMAEKNFNVFSGFRNTILDRNLPKNQWNFCAHVINASSSAQSVVTYLGIGNPTDFSVGDKFYVKEQEIIDLTALFANAPAIADYIYSLEQANAGAGVAWLREHGFLAKDYYPYNPGESISVCVSGHKTVGFNQFDASKSSEWVTLYLRGNEVSGQSSQMKSVIMKCFPNTTYYAIHSKGSRLSLGSFAEYPTTGMASTNEASYSSDSGGHVTYTTGANDKYLFVWFYNANIDTGLTAQQVADTLVVNISDPQKNGTYERYSSTTYPIQSTDLRGLFKLDSANKLYCDGDIYKSDGTVTRKKGSVDLGTVNWRKGSYTFYAPINGMSFKNAEIICAKYLTGTPATNGVDMQDKTICSQRNGTVFIKDDSIFASTTAEQFKNDMNGVYLEYDLATPTTESLTPYTSPVDVVTGGTEEFVDNRTVPVPVGNETYYASEYAVKGKTSISVDHAESSQETPTTYTVTLAPVGTNIIPYDLDRIKTIQNGGEWDGDTYTYRGISYAFQPDGSVILNGTATGGSGVYYWMASVDPIVTLHIPEGYILSGVSGGGLYTYSLDVDSHRCYDPEVLSERDTVIILIDVLGGTTVENLRIKPSITPPVYGGTVDIVSGALSVDYGYLDMGSLNWRRYKFGEIYCFFTNIPDRVSSPNGQKCYCSKYNKVTAIVQAANLANKDMAVNTNQTYIYIRDDSYTDENSFTTALNGTILVYELATPLTYQLTPQQVQMLLNNNYLVTSDGTMTLTYKGPGINVPFSVSCGGESNSYNVELSDKLYKVSAYADSISYDDQTVKREIIVERLTGTEDWDLSDGIFSTELSVKARIQAILCNELSSEQCYLSEDLTTLNITNVPFEYVSELKTWLESKEVYVQYVREQTLVTSHSVPSVSTFNGTNTFSVDTEVTPSEVTIIYPNRVTTRTLPKTKKIGTSKLTKSK